MRKASILINSYNYGRFLGEAISSVLAQENVDLELIVIDDGSTDDSRQVMDECQKRDPRVKLVCQSNAGQLASVNKGIGLASGDVIFFLDSDDVYRPGYLRAVLDHYRDHPEVDFTYCAVQEFGNSNGLRRPYNRTVDLGYSAYRVLTRGTWIGAVTSGLSARKGLLRQFMPVPLEDDWKIGVDDCVIWGISLAGGRKAYLDFVGVGYRVHGENNFMGRPITFNDHYKYLVKVSRLMAYLKARLLPLDPVAIRDWSDLELESMEVVRFFDLQEYLRAALVYEPSAFLFARRAWRLTVIYLRKALKNMRIDS